MAMKITKENTSGLSNESKEIKSNDEVLDTKDTKDPKDELKVQLAKLQQACKNKYGNVCIYRLPNGKRAFFRPADQLQWEEYKMKLDRVLLSEQFQNQCQYTISGIQADVVCSCLINLGASDVVADLVDLKKYPMIMNIIFQKIVTMIGDVEEEDFLS